MKGIKETCPLSLTLGPFDARLQLIKTVKSKIQSNIKQPDRI